MCEPVCVVDGRLRLNLKLTNFKRLPNNRDINEEELELYNICIEAHLLNLIATFLGSHVLKKCQHINCGKMNHECHQSRDITFANKD